MENIFLTVVKMGISASVAALVILIIRWALGNKLHKSFSYALWTIVLIRLIIPFSIPSMVSIFNKVPVPSVISTDSKEYGITQKLTSSSNGTSFDTTKNEQVHNNVENHDLISAFNVDNYDNYYTIDNFITFISYVWLIGVVIILGLSVFAYLDIYNKLQDSVIYKNDSLISRCYQQIKFHRNVKLYTSDKINSPLVCGLLKPRIILPLALTEQCSDDELSHYVCHELVHIKRFDYIIKPLSFLALSIHWLNPLMWLCYILAQKDMELSCDARVLSLSKEDIRKDYANSLINIAAKQNVFLQAGLLAFGEKNIKSRVKGVMKYKKTQLWMSIIGLVIIAALGILLLTNGKTNKSLSLSKLKSNSSSTITNEKLLDSLLEHRSKYVGDASNAMNLLRKLPYGSNIDSISLSTEKRPYGITVNIGKENSSDPKEGLLKQNGLLFFSLIENVDNITFISQTPVTYTREEMQKYFKKDLWSYSKDKETFDRFFLDISTKIKVYPETYSLAMSSVIGIEIDLALDSYYKESDFNITFSANSGHLHIMKGNTLSESRKSITNPEGKVIWSPNISTDSSQGDTVTIFVTDKSGKHLITKQLNITQKSVINYKVEASYDVIFEAP